VCCYVDPDALIRGALPKVERVVPNPLAWGPTWKRVQSLAERQADEKRLKPLVRSFGLFFYWTTGLECRNLEAGNVRHQRF
jgi:hypothetical protein